MASQAKKQKPFRHFLTRNKPFPEAILIGCGRTRLVFGHSENPFIVVKVPIPSKNKLKNQKQYYNCLTDNNQEYRIFQKYKDEPDINGIRYARCYLLDNGWLVMEKVVPLVNNRPSWADFVDCGQVGLTVDGRIVAYDYGLL